MIDESSFLTLLTRMEDETLDFKAKPYILSKDGDGGIDLVKDVLCMANTPRECSSFIILGVKKHSDGKYDLHGIEDHPDEADLQQQFTARTFPIPSFTYYPLFSNGKSFGVIEIFPQKLGPCVPIKDLPPGLRQYQIYFRRGSKNDIAQPNDVIRIVSWLTETNSLDARLDDVPAWDKYYSAVHGFDPLYGYIMVASPLRDLECEHLSIWNLAPLVAVIDFDPESETEGLLGAVAQEPRPRRSIHKVTKGNSVSLDPARGTYWFFARGLTGRQSSLPEDSWRKWKIQYGQELKRQVEHIAKALLPSPVVCLVIWEDFSSLRYLQSMLDELLSGFGPAIEFVFVAEDTANLQAISAEHNGALISIPPAHMAAGMRLIFDELAQEENGEIRLPSRSGVPIQVQSVDQPWLEEDLTLIHLGIGTIRPDGRKIGEDFLRGQQIEWYELGLHFDVDRDISERLERQIRRDLEANRTVRVNLFHSPGAGGTTLARRIVWNVHRTFPCAVLRRLAPEETTERLYRIASITGLALLLVIDGAVLSDRQVEQLFEELRSRQIPVVLLQVLRRFYAHEARERSFYLPGTLDPVESRRFAEVFSRSAPQKRGALETLASSLESKQRSPFYFGLLVFEREFLALSPYVNARMRDLSPTSRRILTLIALVHHYAQQAIPVQIFANLLGLPRDRPVKLELVMAPGALELLIEPSSGTWRTMHELIAMEILEQELGGADRRLWKQNLSTIVIEFIDICASSAAAPPESLLETLRRALIYRDNVDLTGSEGAAIKRFSHLIDDIPSREGSLEVLKQLVNSYPNEAHFWAHLARFYSLKMKSPNDALVSIEKALALEDEDHLLHHMKGMIFRSCIQDLIETREPIASMASLAADACQCFARARELDPDDEHGYISEVQMLIRLLDYAGQDVGGRVLQYISSPAASPFLREAFEKAEDLLEQVRRNREGESPSSYELNCRASLDSLFGEHEKALQIWDNLLSQKDIYGPPLRRQIVRTYLVRRQREWSKLNPKELKRSVDLLEQNLHEDPYNEKDLRLWIQAVRRPPCTISITAAIERVAYWRSRTGSLEATFYLYVLHSILALEGSVLNRDEAEMMLSECRQLARRRRNRRRSFEWLGLGEGVAALVHQSELGEWQEDIDFWAKPKLLKRITGRIAWIEGPQAGSIEVQNGLEAFFVPGRGHFYKGQAENQAVELYLGFSYDGLRAWDVHKI